MRFQDQGRWSIRRRIGEAEIAWFLSRMTLVREAEARLRDELDAIVDEDDRIVLVRTETPSLTMPSEKGAYP